MPQYILREFKVTDAREGSSRTVRQFQFTDWPEQGVPKYGDGFIDFIGQVHKTKEQFGQDGPITVHCRYSPSTLTLPLCYLPKLFQCRGWQNWSFHHAEYSFGKNAVRRSRRHIPNGEDFTHAKTCHGPNRGTVRAMPIFLDKNDDNVCVSGPISILLSSCFGIFGLL
jgi:hypothetical protein